MAPIIYNVLILTLARAGLSWADQRLVEASKTTVAPASTLPTDARALVSALSLATNEQDQLAVLVPDPSDISNLTYTFVNNTVLPPTGGTISLSSVSVFPALLTTNVAMAIGFVNPCGLNTPHSHPRANEFLTVVQNELVSGLILEENPGSIGLVKGQVPSSKSNGTLPQVGTTLKLYDGTVFPQGSVHFQFNPTCQPSVFAAAFDNRDPGRIEIARNFFSLRPNEVIDSSLGSDGSILEARDVDFLESRIPGSFATLMKECAKRCGIGKKH